ncbi:hypothetical protein ABIE37_002281 [Arthrobacter bambusae]|uniref:Uncharacterized protein n=1 Tax=Arthrobacter bambusae TaxID=1338426 RepID=A0ABV2P7E2_9MICC
MTNGKNAAVPMPLSPSGAEGGTSRLPGHCAVRVGGNRVHLESCRP